MRVRCSNLVRPSFVCANFAFFSTTYFVTSVKICTMIEVSSEQWKGQLCTYADRMLLPLLMCVAVLLLLLHQQYCCFVLLFVIVCRMAKLGAGSYNLIPVLSFPSFKRDLFSMYRLAVLCVACTSRFAYIISNCGHARSQGGHQPAAVNPRL